MAADSNMGFHQGTIPSSLCNRLMLSFQSGARTSATEMISGGMSSPGMNSSTREMFLSGNPSMITNIPSINAAGSSSSNVHHDHVHRFKPGTVSGSDWSAQEVVKLNEGLIKPRQLVVAEEAIENLVRELVITEELVDLAGQVGVEEEELRDLDTEDILGMGALLMQLGFDDWYSSSDDEI